MGATKFKFQTSHSRKQMFQSERNFQNSLKTHCPTCQASIAENNNLGFVFGLYIARLRTTETSFGAEITTVG